MNHCSPKTDTGTLPRQVKRWRQTKIGVQYKPNKQATVKYNEWNCD